MPVAQPTYVRISMFRFLLASVLFTGLAFSAAAQAPKDAKEPAKDGEKKLVLRYFGNSFFQLETTKGKKIVFDPHAIMAFGRPNPEVVGDIVLISHLHNDHTQVG